MNLTSKDFEHAIDETNRRYKDLGIASLGRYGVQTVWSDKGAIAIKSLPDYEGIKHGGHHIIFDAKVCSQASFALGEYRRETKGSKQRQLSHMLDRAEYGATCGFLIHWNQRVLTHKVDQMFTCFFPIHPQLPFWVSFDRAEIKSITREVAQDLGVLVPWQPIGEADRKNRPDYLASLQELAHA